MKTMIQTAAVVITVAALSGCVAVPYDDGPYYNYSGYSYPSYSGYYYPVYISPYYYYPYRYSSVYYSPGYYRPYPGHHVYYRGHSIGHSSGSFHGGGNFHHHR